MICPSCGVDNNSDVPYCEDCCVMLAPQLVGAQIFSGAKIETPQSASSPEFPSAAYAGEAMPAALPTAYAGGEAAASAMPGAYVGSEAAASAMPGAYAGGEAAAPALPGAYAGGEAAAPALPGASAGSKATLAALLAPSKFAIAPSLLQQELRRYPTWFLAASGGMIFTITVVAILIVAATWRAAHEPGNNVVVVPDNAAAQAVAKNDPNMLLLRKPGDTWTYTFTRDSVDGLGKETLESGAIVEKTGRLIKHDKPLIVDSAVTTFTEQGGQKQTRTYVGYDSQSANRNLYLLGYSDDNPNKVHYYAAPELVDKGDWSRSPSFDVSTETGSGVHTHSYVTVQPDPVTLNLSNKTQVTCWNRTISVVADGYNETDTDLYCPAIGANITSKSEITYTNGAKRTTNTTLTHFSLAN